MVLLRGEELRPAKTEPSHWTRLIPPPVDSVIDIPLNYDWLNLYYPILRLTPRERNYDKQRFADSAIE